MFKVGDIVTGRLASPYLHATNLATMSVEWVDKDSMLVKVLSHKTSQYVVGECFVVDPKHFILIRG